MGAKNLLDILLEQKVKQNVSKHTSKNFLIWQKTLKIL